MDIRHFIDGREIHGRDTATAIHFYEADYYVFSNFSAFKLRWVDIDFDTSEHAYQWSKFGGDDREVRKLRTAIIYSRSAHEAFKLAEANKHLVRPNWSQQRISVMYDIITAKCEQHDYVSRKLADSGTRTLIEDSWRDSFWGWGPNRDGKNMLGRLWMFRRQSSRGAARQIDWEYLMNFAVAE